MGLLVRANPAAFVSVLRMRSDMDSFLEVYALRVDLSGKHLPTSLPTFAPCQLLSQHLD